MEHSPLLRRASGVPTMETERLVLTKIKKRDAREMYAYAKKECVSRYLTWMPHRSYWYTRSYIALLQQKYESCEFFDWGVHEKSSGRFIGTCGFTSINETDLSGEIGYVLSPKFWGKGYAVEAARCVLRFAFEELGLRVMSARFLYGNVQSERVMQKLGMREVGVLPDSMYIKGKWRTVLEYRITKEEFK